jgi:hypothetical protein
MEERTKHTENMGFMKRMDGYSSSSHATCCRAGDLLRRRIRCRDYSCTFVVSSNIRVLFPFLSMGGQLGVLNRILKTL